MSKETISIAVINSPELKAVDPSKAKQIEVAFAPMVKMLESFEDQYSEVISSASDGITSSVTARAKTLRLSISKVRTESDKLRRASKENVLREGRAIDGVFNILKWAVTEKEDKLKEIEKHFENELVRKQEEIQLKRRAELGPYVSTMDMPDELYNMADDVWDAYLFTKKTAHNDRVKAEKSALLAKEEKARVEREERERLRVENEQLRKEQEERELALRKENAARELKLIAEKKAHEEREVKLRREREKSEAEAREKIERAESELRAIKEKEQRKAEEAESKRQEDLNRGDSDKMKALISELGAIIYKYEFKSDENNFRRRRAIEIIKMAINELEKE